MEDFWSCDHFLDFTHVKIVLIETAANILIAIQHLFALP